MWQWPTARLYNIKFTSAPPLFEAVVICFRVFWLVADYKQHYKFLHKSSCHRSKLSIRKTQFNYLKSKQFKYKSIEIKE